MKERIWKTIEGFDGLYEVSNDGFVRSLDRIVKHRPSSRALSGCRQLRKGRVLKPSNVGSSGKNGSFYKKVTLVDVDGVKSYHRVHRLVAQAFVPNLENKPEVDHINGLKDDNRVENLEWVTSRENSKRCIRTGLQSVQGEDHNMSKLTELEVIEIRKLYNENKMGVCDIARAYNLNRNTISNVVHRKSWTHVK